MPWWQAKPDSTDTGGPLPGGVRGQPGAGLCLLGSIQDPPYYRQSRETSVYLSPGATGRGLGTRLYAELLKLLRRDGTHLVVAVAGRPNHTSNVLHRSQGFTEAGTLDEIGFKFGACISTTWFQLLPG